MRLQSLLSTLARDIGLRKGRELATKMARCRDAAACPRCGAPIGSYCLNDGQATIHEERRRDAEAIDG